MGQKHQAGWGKMRARSILTTLTLLMAGCAKYDLQTLPKNQMTVLGPGEYQYKTVADVYWGDKRAGAERARLDAVANVMKANGFCPNGYKVVDRKSVIRTRSAVGLEVRDVFYRIRCQ